MRAERTATALLAAPRPAAVPPPPAGPDRVAAIQPVDDAVPAADGRQTPLLVLFGSNLGTAEGLAHGIAEDARRRGFVATVGPLDEQVGALPNDGAVIVVTASYNGQPPDNAAKFCKWLRDASLPPDAFAGVEYSVFGCGNRDWAATYQAIPALIDAELEKHGARRAYGRGEGDARGDFDRDYRAWHGGLFPSLAKALRLPEDVGAKQEQAAGPRFSVSFIYKLAASPIVRSYSGVVMTVRSNRELQRRDCERPSDRSTRHVGRSRSPRASRRGPSGRHPAQRTRRAPPGAAAFQARPQPLCDHHAERQLRHAPAGQRAGSASGRPGQSDRADTATRAQLATLAAHAKDESERQRLMALAADDEGSEAR